MDIAAASLRATVRPFVSAPLRPARDDPQRVVRLFAAHLPEGVSDVLSSACEGMVVHCRSGMLWITHDGDPRDVVLREGECHRIDCDRPMTVHALKDCGFEIEMPGGPGGHA
jgi:hypothetical protein